MDNDRTQPNETLAPSVEKLTVNQTQQATGAMVEKGKPSEPIFSRFSFIEAFLTKVDERIFNGFFRRMQLEEIEEERKMYERFAHTAALNEGVTTSMVFDLMADRFHILANDQAFQTEQHIRRDERRRHVALPISGIDVVKVEGDEKTCVAQELTYPNDYMRNRNGKRPTKEYILYNPDQEGRGYGLKAVEYVNKKGDYSYQYFFGYNLRGSNGVMTVEWRNRENIDFGTDSLEAFYKAFGLYDDVMVQAAK